MKSSKPLCYWLDQNTNKIEKHYFQIRSSKRAKTQKSGEVNEEWTKDLFDISKCKSKITENTQAFNGKLACDCPWEDRILEIEGPFLIDQRSVRKLMSELWP